MLLIKNLKDLKRNQSKIKKALISSLMLDIDSIGEFESQSDEYGPLILILYDKETGELHKKYPIIKEIYPEEDELIYEDDKETITRQCYILTDGGFILYVRKNKNV